MTDISQLEIEAAKRTYNETFLANRPEQHGHAMGMAAHNAANDAAFRAVLAQFLEGRTSAGRAAEDCTCVHGSHGIAHHNPDCKVHG